MIVSKQLKFIYLALPRTGSKSIVSELILRYQGREIGGHHQMRVPNRYHSYLIFTVVRHPARRMYSAYARSFAFKESLTFDQFLLSIMHGGEENIVSSTQVSLLGASNIPLSKIVILKLEQIGHLFLNTRIPTKHPRLTRRQTDLVEMHSAEDFRVFGYESQ